MSARLCNELNYSTLITALLRLILQAIINIFTVLSHHQLICTFRSFRIAMNLQWTYKFWIKFLRTKLPWFIITVVFGFLTVKSCSVIILKFITGTTSTTVTTVFTKNISLLQSTLCIPIISSQLYNISRSEANRSESFYSDFVAFGAESGMFLKDSLLNNNQSWSNETLLFIIHHYLACMTNFEFFVEYDTACFKNETDDDLFQAIIEFAEQLQKNNISSDDLRQRFGREIAADYSLTVTKQSGLQTNAVDVDFSKTTFVNNYRICYRMRFDLHPLQRGITDAFVIEATPPLTNWKKFSYVKSVLGVPFVNIDLIGRSAPTFLELRNDNAVTSSRFTEAHYFVPITIASISHAMPFINGTIRCSENQSLDACHAECKETYIRDACNCTSTVKNYASPVISTVQCRFRA